MEAKHATPKELKDVVALLSRMMPTLMQGQTFEQAGNTVLGRDRKLFEITTADTEQGALIRKHLSDRVFDEANIINHAKTQAMVAADLARLAVLTDIERATIKESLTVQDALQSQ